MYKKHTKSAHLVKTTSRILLLSLAAIIAFMPLMPPALAAYCAIASYLAWPVFLLCLIEAVRLRRAHIWSIAFTSAAIISIVWIRHFLPAQKTIDIDRKDVSLRLISGNIDNFGIHFQDYDNLRSQAELIRSYHPDIICLQERPHTNVISFDSIRKAFKDYPYYFTNSREDEVLNLVIFSRYPLSNPAEYYFPDSFNKIIGVNAKVGEQSLRLFNVHLQTTGASVQNILNPICLTNTIRHEKQRNHQADTLCHIISGCTQPVIVSGDFNASRTSYAYRRLAAVLSDCSKATIGIHGSWQPLGSLLKIDHTLCSPCLQTRQYAVADNPWSDHRLQIISFKL